MFTIRPVTLLCCAMFFPFLPAAQDRSEYAGLLAALKAGNIHIDYTRLRLSFVGSPERKKARDTSGEEKKMFGALEDKDYASALENAERVLANDYVSIDAQFVASVANRELKRPDKAEFHRAVALGLIDSIRSSGDGKSPKTAWVVISVDEEYALLRVLGFQHPEQSLIQKEGHFYDAMQVKPAAGGSEETYYFNTDIPIREEKF